jgi:hypothetical protein
MNTEPKKRDLVVTRAFNAPVRYGRPGAIPSL